MKPPRPVYLLGGAHTPFIGKFHPDFVWRGHPDFGKKQNPTIEEHLQKAVLDALAATGVAASAVQKGYVGNFTGEIFAKQGHLGASLAAADPAFRYKPFMRVEGACASGGLALSAAVDAISAGFDLVLAVGVEVQTTLSAKEGADALARAAHYATQRSIDPFMFPCLFARRAKAYRQAYDVSEADLATVVLKAYENASKNPFAHMRAFKMTAEHARAASDRNPYFLSNLEYKDWLKVSDCSQVSDGASCAILASEAGLDGLGKSRGQVVQIAAYGHATAPLSEEADPLEFATTKAAAKEAYSDSGTGPDKIQVAEVHDCFSIAEILMYEALGFAEKGKGIELAKEGTTRLEGRLPVNTGGGLIAFGHPVGATGTKQAVEIFRQMKGLCGDYQMKVPPKVGLSANMGGDDRTAVVTIYKA
jgi:acetyl-CoA acyltransferase